MNSPQPPPSVTFTQPTPPPHTARISPRAVLIVSLYATILIVSQQALLWKLFAIPASSTLWMALEMIVCKVVLFCLCTALAESFFGENGIFFVNNNMFLIGILILTFVAGSVYDAIRLNDSTLASIAVMETVTIFWVTVSAFLLVSGIATKKKV